MGAANGKQYFYRPKVLTVLYCTVVLDWVVAQAADRRGLDCWPPDFVTSTTCRDGAGETGTTRQDREQEIAGNIHTREHGRTEV